ncbi:hypothetical protein [Flavobacterium sp.]|uniref:hypothetical protein n=1 Tax=Flavobacterium sp. TaxID=239 RepID=UPI00286DAC30|nr:hypothetical protein [Flavobacterium sp.]
MFNPKKNENNNSLGTYNSKYIDFENVLINNHKVILSKSDFESIHNKIDSTKTMIWECGSPFEWLDEEWMIKTYGNKTEESGAFDTFNGEITTLFGKDIEFNTNNNIVLFDKAFAKNNSFEIISHRIKLNKNTSLEDFKKMFPNSEMEILEERNEVRFRFYLNDKADDAFLFYFKKGKLNYFTLWWLLC